MEKHTCSAVVVRCMDYRLDKLISKLLKDINVESYDIVSLAGATKNSIVVIENIKLSVQLHSAKRVILIHHEDCGAYGPVSQETHRNAMLVVKTCVDRLNLGVTVECYFLHLDGAFEDSGIIPALFLSVLNLFSLLFYSNLLYSIHAGLLYCIHRWKKI
jgi:hypothetical protein